MLNFASVLDTNSLLLINLEVSYHISVTIPSHGKLATDLKDPTCLGQFLLMPRWGLIFSAVLLNRPEWTGNIPYIVEVTKNPVSISYSVQDTSIFLLSAFCFCSQTVCIM